MTNQYINFKVRLMCRNRVNKEGLSKVEVEVLKYDSLNQSKLRRFVDTKQLIFPKNWNQKTQKISSKELDFKEKQANANLIYGGVLSFVNSDGKQIPDDIDITSLTSFFPKANTTRRKSLVEYIDSYYKIRINNKTKRGTAKEFLTVKNRVKNFDIWNTKITYFEQINIIWSNQFEDYLRNEKKYSDGTIEKSYTILRTVLNYYYENRDDYNIDLSDKFNRKTFKRGSKSINKANPLTMLQLMALYNHQFKTDHLNTIKKMICIQAFTGCRYGDIKTFRPDNFKNDFLIFIPKKTEHHKKKIEVVQPLNAYAKALFVEVNYDTSIYKMHNQPYNRGIKEVFNILRPKYTKLEYGTYTSHNFRDTFITNCVEAEINWKSIIKWVGHTTYNMMNRYIHLSPEFETTEMNKMFKYMVVKGKIVYYKE